MSDRLTRAEDQLGELRVDVGEMRARLELLNASVTSLHAKIDLLTPTAQRLSELEGQMGWVRRVAIPAILGLLASLGVGAQGLLKMFW